MVNLIAFQTSEDLEKITGLSRDELWNVGFNLDDWDAGFQSDVKLHSKGDKCGVYECDLEYNDDCPAYWLMMQMSNYCIGADYVEYKGKHYYMVHHA